MSPLLVLKTCLQRMLIWKTADTYCMILLGEEIPITLLTINGSLISLQSYQLWSG